MIRSTPSSLAKNTHSGSSSNSNIMSLVDLANLRSKLFGSGLAEAAGPEERATPAKHVTFAPSPTTILPRYHNDNSIQLVIQKRMQEHEQE
jgi:hypothetical protein